MKRLIASTSLAGSLFLTSFAADAGIITLYDIDFSSPTHTVGIMPSIGTGVDQISGINSGRPTVESSYAGSDNPSLHFNAASGTSEQIRLNMGQGYNNYQISYDFFSTDLSGSDYAFVLLADTPQVRNFSFNGVSGVRYWAPYVLPINGGNFADNTSYHVSIDYDLLLGSVSVSLNGGLLGSRAFETSGDDIESFRFSLAQARAGNDLEPTASVNLDNILVTSRTPAGVPEPSTLLLLSLGMLSLVSARSIAGSTRKRS